MRVVRGHDTHYLGETDMITGEKVQLRPIERDDLPRFVKWFSDPEVHRHLAVWLPFSLGIFSIIRGKVPLRGHFRA